MSLKVRIDLNNNNNDNDDDDAAVCAPAATSAGCVLAIANRPGSIVRL
jgi:hypothetical protein